MPIGTLLAKRGTKAAIVLCAAGEPMAARLLSRLEAEELRRLSQLANSVGSISLRELDAVVEEFAGNLVSTVGLQGPAAAIARLIDASLNPAPAVEDTVSTNVAPTAAAKDILEALSKEDLIELLTNECVQIATGLLSLLSSSCAAAALEAMPAERRMRLLHRMLVARPMTEKSRELLEAAVREAFAKEEPREFGKERQVRIASIVNRLDEQQVAEVVAEFERANPRATATLRELLFTFPDIARLSPKARATVFDKVATEQMVLALLGVDAALRELVLSSLTARGRRMIEAELSGRPAPVPSEVRAAKRAISDLVLDMASRSEIELPKSQGGN
jgi:flagellar motor switch protein FliG